MEPVFRRFDSFDFEADRRFVDGLKTLQTSDGGGDAERVLDLKLFFYNRFVEPIDRSLYRQQKSSPAAGGEQTAPSLSGRDVSESGAAETSERLSFAEVMRLVQEGKEVPGVTKPDVRPSNQSPTPSQMSRRLKPWENGGVLPLTSES